MRTLPPSRTHLLPLDGVRGLAILVVLLHNLSIVEARDTLRHKLWTFAVEFGWVGVELFFVLSGFLITGILVDDKDQPNRLRTFYVRRFLRIFPLYYAFLIVYFAVNHVPWSESIWYWLYLSNWSILFLGELHGLGHVWSLAVEEQFYLVWPTLAGRVRASTLAWICVVIIVVSFLSRVVLHFLGAPSLATYASTITRADSLAFGALVALAIRSEVWRPRLERAERPVGIASLFVLGAITLVTHGVNRQHPVVQTIGYSVLALACAVFVGAAAKGRGPRWLGNRVLVFFGKYSYAIYVLHSPLKHVYMAVLGPRLVEAEAARPILADVLLIVVVSLSATLGALVTGAVLERPFLKLKDRWAPR